MKRKYAERPLVKTKIIATAGPACADPDTLRELVLAGVDLFRLNFAHGKYEWLGELLKTIRAISIELKRPIGVLGDLAGPKIRLGELPPDGILCMENDLYEFVRGHQPADGHKLTCTYEQLVDDLRVGNRIVLADGSVEMHVIEKHSDRVVCIVNRTGTIRSRQGVNLPGVDLTTPCLTDKDRADLEWALANGLDYLGLSFVRKAEDIRQLRRIIQDHHLPSPPHIVAKIEKLEAINDLEAILQETDAVMVARGDLGVEVDITRVPTLQKRIIKLCNKFRIPVITATQMLDSMQQNEFPTRAEASDVANAVLDGSDAVMLSGETAVGKFPRETVAMMSQIAHEAERMVESGRSGEWDNAPRTRALIITEAITIGANAAAEFLDADLVVVATQSGRTAMAISRQRCKVPILALTNREDTARRMTLYWGVTPMTTDGAYHSPQELLNYVVEWGRRENVLQSGSRVLLISKTSLDSPGHNSLLVHVVS